MYQACRELLEMGSGQVLLELAGLSPGRKERDWFLVPTESVRSPGHCCGAKEE